MFPEQVRQQFRRHSQASEIPLYLWIERHRFAGLGIEDRDAQGRDVDQGLQVGPGPLFVSERAGVRDRRRLSTTSNRTVLWSRIELMRRLAALS